MDFKIKMPRSIIERVLFYILLTYHLVNVLLATFAVNWVNKYVLAILFLTYIYFVKYYGKRKPILIISVSVAVIFYTLYNALLFGIAQVLHSDYYSFVLLLLLLIAYSEDNIRKKFLAFFLEKFRLYLGCTFLFIVVLLLSIGFNNGLHVAFGTTIPILYGPYNAAHVLGYILIGIYCAVSLYQYCSKDKCKIILALKVLCVIFTLWTAARSAVLAMAIVLAADYLSMKNRSKKVIVFMLALIAMLYLVMFTDFLYEIPLIQKTINAAALGSITNGRERFAEYLLKYYRTEENIIQKLVGIGMNNLRGAMNILVNSEIHAHNDYVNALVGYGIIGLILYICSQIKTFLASHNKPFALLMILMLSILSYFNGLAMYTAFTPSLIIVFLYFERSSIQDYQ